MPLTESPADISNLHRFLQESYLRVVDWLKYAEAKNGVFLTFASVILALSVSALAEGDLKEYKGPLVVAAIASGVVALLMLTSFLAILKYIDFYLGAKSVEKRNLLFYSDIALFDPLELQRALVDRYNFNQVTDKLSLDYCDQIINISKIAVRKNKIFNISLWLLSLSGSVAIVYFFIILLG